MYLYLCTLWKICVRKNEIDCFKMTHHNLFLSHHIRTFTSHRLRKPLQRILATPSSPPVNASNKKNYEPRGSWDGRLHRIFHEFGRLANHRSDTFIHRRRPNTQRCREEDTPPPHLQTPVARIIPWLQVQKKYLRYDKSWDIWFVIHDINRSNDRWTYKSLSVSRLHRGLQKRLLWEKQMWR